MIYMSTNRDILKRHQFDEDIKSGKAYLVQKVPFDELYIDIELNVYPFCYISHEFLLGNLRDSANKIVEQIKNCTNLPESIQHKRKQEFEELVLEYGDAPSNQLYTPHLSL